MLYKIMSIFIVINFLIPSLFAQKSIDWKLKAKAKHEKFEFTMPSGFHELDSGERFPCGDMLISGSDFYAIGNKDTSIRISIYSISTQLTDNHSRVARRRADTVNSTLVFYTNDYVSERFNADEGGEYSRNCPLPFKGTYPYHRIVFVYKKGRGHFELTYFFTEQSVKAMDAIIRETSGMIRYLD
jgi:hypothetical protein